MAIADIMAINIDLSRYVHMYLDIDHIIQRSRNVPPRNPVDPVEDGILLNNLMTRAEHQFPGEFNQHRSRHAVESLEECMLIIIRTTVHKEANCIVMRENDVALVETTYQICGNQWVLL